MIWELKFVYLDNFDWFAETNYKNKSVNAYPIILKSNDSFEVLDGKFRIGMYKTIGLRKTLMWVGNSEI